jgi:UDP-N-acetylglucosamine 4-epimerase
VVNEYFAKVYSELYGIETIGLRYFNVFGKRQDPNGAYAAVIPLWVKALINHQQPVINGDGTYSRDFTYIDNVIQANELAAITPSEVILERLREYFNSTDNLQPITDNFPNIVMDVFNVAFGGNTTLFQLYNALKTNLSKHDPAIANIDVIIGSKRQGDIPHSMASVDKAKAVLSYAPKYDAKKGFEEACEWYYDNLK